jgi:branched-chain amino acid transport system permease protein
MFSFASLTDVHWTMSGTPVLATLLGGLGTVFGPVLGSLMIVSLEVELADTPGPWSRRQRPRSRRTARRP